MYSQDRQTVIGGARDRYNTHTLNKENNNNNKSKSFLGSGMYQVLMLLFLLGAILNCILGRGNNDKHATAWYNAHKTYFKERYNMAISDEAIENNKNTYNTPMMYHLFT